MPVSLHELLGDVAERQVTIGGATLTSTYRPTALTPDMLERVVVSERPPADDAPESEIMARVWAAVDILLPTDGQLVLVSWDLFEDDAATIPVPITRTRLAHLALGILWGVIRGMLESSRMGEANGAPSPQPSAASSARSSGAGSRKRG